MQTALTSTPLWCTYECLGIEPGFVGLALCQHSYQVTSASCAFIDQLIPPTKHYDRGAMEVDKLID